MDIENNCLKPTNALAVSTAIENLKDIGLNEKMIIALVHDKTKIAKKTIKRIIESILTIEKIIISNKTRDINEKE